MARLLKNPYLKTSYTKFCSSSTKTNPYVQVLKTLRSWEQDLRNQSKILPQNNEGGKAPGHYALAEKSKSHSNNTTAASSPENIIKNPHHKNSFHKDTEGTDKSSSMNRDVNKSPSIIHPLSHTNISKQIHEHEKRTTYVNETKTNAELYRTTAAVPKANYVHDSDKKANLSMETLQTNTSSSKTSNHLNCDRQKDNVLYVYYPGKFENNTTGKIGKNIVNESKFKKKKSKKSKNETVDTLGKRISNLKHLFNEISETGNVNELFINLNLKEKSDVMKFSSSEKKTFDELASNAEIVKKGKKSKNSKKKGQVSSAVKEDQKLKAKEESAVQSLKSLIEAYINANEVSKAHRTFEYLLHDQKKKKMVDVHLYNIVIAGWAREGRLDKVKHLLLLMSNDKITPNLQSYAGYLEAISRSKCVDVSEIPKIVSEMKSHGFSHKDLLQNCIFVGDQREKIIEALGFVERDLSLPAYVPGEAYSYKLLEKLNDKNYEKGKTPFYFGFDAKEIPKLTSIQMEIEEKSVIKIKSVIAITELTDKIIKCREYIKECENIWKKRLTKAINNLKTAKKQHQGNKDVR